MSFVKGIKAANRYPGYHIQKELKHWRTYHWIHFAYILRVVKTQAILFLKSMSERGGSDIERF